MVVRRPGPGGGLGTRRPGLQLLRAAFMVGSGAGFFLALRHLPLAEGYLVYFTAPFMLLALFRVLLKEPVPARAWGWCAVGFTGVLLALWPGLSAGGAWAAYAWGMLGSFCHAMVLVMNRSLRDEPGMARLILWTAAPALPLLVPWAGPSGRRRRPGMPWRWRRTGCWRGARRSGWPRPSATPARRAWRRWSSRRWSSP